MNHFYETLLLLDQNKKISKDVSVVYFENKPK